ncbi:MAG TPA: hypothetical protein VK184_01115 [Nostocaceae cyanobacterium]|nr:hypothetical protein [Nostocaceae cyanobacterium]
MSFEFLCAINGLAQIWAVDGKFLGVLTSDKYDPHSISNSRSIYGSVCGAASIRNSSGLYGSSNGVYSAYNPNCLHPPIIFYQEQPVLIVSKNTNLQNEVNGLPVVDPDLLLEYYTQIVHTVSSFKPAQALVNK